MLVAYAQRLPLNTHADVYSGARGLKASEYDQQMPQSHTTVHREEEAKNNNSNMTSRKQ